MSTESRVTHMPQRTCVACRQVRNKRELIRIVLVGDRILVDPAGKRPGRGAYLCPLPGCWERGLNSNRIEHALRTKLSGENREELVRFGRELSKLDSQPYLLSEI